MPRQGCVIRDVSQTIQTGCWLQGRVVCRWPNCTRAIYHVRKVLAGFSMLVDTHGSIVGSVYAAVPLGMTGGACWKYSPSVSILRFGSTENHVRHHSSHHSARLIDVRHSNSLLKLQFPRRACVVSEWMVKLNPI